MTAIAGRVADRRTLIAKVHVAKKQLAMEDGSYRALLTRITGKESAGECTEQQLLDVLAEFARLGFKGKPTAASAEREHMGQVAKIYAIWNDIAPLLVVPHDQSALRSFVQRQTKSAAHPNGLAAPEFCRGRDAVNVIEGLKGWRARLLRQREQQRRMREGR